MVPIRNVKFVLHFSQMHSFKAALFCYVGSALVLYYNVRFGDERYDNIK